MYYLTTSAPHALDRLPILVLELDQRHDLDDRLDILVVPLYEDLLPALRLAVDLDPDLGCDHLRDAQELGLVEAVPVISRDLVPCATFLVDEPVEAGVHALPLELVRGPAIVNRLGRPVLAAIRLRDVEKEAIYALRNLRARLGDRSVKSFQALERRGAAWERGHFITPIGDFGRLFGQSDKFCKMRWQTSGEADGDASGRCEAARIREWLLQIVVAWQETATAVVLMVREQNVNVLFPNAQSELQSKLTMLWRQMTGTQTNDDFSTKRSGGQILQTWMVQHRKTCVRNRQAVFVAKSKPVLCVAGRRAANAP